MSVLQEWLQALTEIADLVIQSFTLDLCLHEHVNFLLLHVLVEAKVECYSDNDCQYSEVCHQGSCADACLVTKCGANARCESSYHSGKCICPRGYTGNPQIACTPCKLTLKLSYILNSNFLFSNLSMKSHHG